MNRDNHNIHRAYQKSRLLREQTEEDGTEDTRLSELETWENKHPVSHRASSALQFYFDERMDQLIDEFEKKLGKEWYRGNLDGQTPHEYHWNTGIQDSIINDLIEKHTSKTKDGQSKIFNDKKNKWISDDLDIFDYLYNQYMMRDNVQKDTKDDFYDDEGSNGSHDEDPTGQDEPIDYRTQREIRNSDQLDAARHKRENDEREEDN